MLGYSISYKGNTDKSRVLLNHSLFGRLMYKRYRGKKTAYYFPGMLDKIPFARLHEGKIFLEHIDFVDINELNILGSATIEPCEREEEEFQFKTAREHWFTLAKERGYPIRVGKKKKKND